MGEFQGWNSLKKMNSEFYIDFDHISIAATCGEENSGERMPILTFGLSHADKG